MQHGIFHDGPIHEIFPQSSGFVEPATPQAAARTDSHLQSQPCVHHGSASHMGCIRLDQHDQLRILSLQLPLPLPSRSPLLTLTPVKNFTTKKKPLPQLVS